MQRVTRRVSVQMTIVDIPLQIDEHYITSESDKKHFMFMMINLATISQSQPTIPFVHQFPK